MLEDGLTNAYKTAFVQHAALKLASTSLLLPARYTVTGFRNSCLQFTTLLNNATTALLPSPFTLLSPISCVSPLPMPKEPFRLPLLTTFPATQTN